MGWTDCIGGAFGAATAAYEGRRDQELELARMQHEAMLRFEMRLVGEATNVVTGRFATVLGSARQVNCPSCGANQTEVRRHRRRCAYCGGDR